MSKFKRCSSSALTVKPPDPGLLGEPEPQPWRGHDTNNSTRGRGHGLQGLAVQPRAVRPARQRRAEVGRALRAADPLPSMGSRARERPEH